MGSNEKTLTDGNGKNNGTIKCFRCSSVILLPNKAEFLKKEDGIFLQHIKKVNTTGDSTGEILYDYWVVHDMFAFENIGFCNTVDNVKYLACADCELGPVGAQFLDNKNNFYVAVDRVSMT